jgi:hypothetical protein
MVAQRTRQSRRDNAVMERHGRSGTTEYQIWGMMLARCFHATNPNFPDYGGRGIRVCDRWRNSFIAFHEDMGDRPSRDHSIDRINNDGSYTCGKCEDCKATQSPSNCRWATRKQQANNTRRTNGPRYSYHKGYMAWQNYKAKRLLCAEWSKSFAVFLAECYGQRRGKTYLVRLDRTQPASPGNFTWSKHTERFYEVQDLAAEAFATLVEIRRTLHPMRPRANYTLVVL